MTDRFGGIPIEETTTQTAQAGADRFGGAPVSQVTSETPIGRLDSHNVDFAEIDKALLSIPGVPSLAEFAAGFNRSAAGFLDFIGPDNVNALLQVAGSEKRVPTFSQLTVPPGTFVEPGLQQQVFSTAGEVAPAALGIGQALRSLAARLPQATAGESASVGTLRQTGQATAKQDIVGGAAAGAGQELGREAGGETGALVGGVVAPLSLAAVPLASAKKVASKLMQEAAPSIKSLKDAARGIYQSIDDSGISIPAQQFDALADDILEAVTTGSGRHVQDLTPRANAIIRTFTEGKGTPKSLSEIDDLRQIAREVGASPVGRERRLSSITTEKIDNFLDDLTSQVDGQDAGVAFKAARDLWQRARKVEILETAVVDAQSQASGFENGLRTQFRAIAKKINRGKLKGFTKEETQAIEKVNKGTKAGNIARFLGKFGILDGVTSRSLTTLGGAGLAGSATGSPVAAIAVPGIGQVSSALAQRMTVNNAKFASSVIRAGKNSNLITNLYLRNTHASARSATELAELFIKNKVPLEAINIRKARPLISDAAIIASIAMFNDENE